MEGGEEVGAGLLNGPASPAWCVCHHEAQGLISDIHGGGRESGHGALEGSGLDPIECNREALSSDDME